MRPILTREGTIVTPGDARTFVVFGERVDVLLTGQETAGAFCTYELTTEPGGGPPPHVQSREDESFYVLEGEFEILCGDRTVTAGPGSFVYFPRQVPHTYKNVGQTTGRLLGFATPAGHEDFFAEIDGLGRNGPPDPEVAIVACRRHGIEILV